MKKKTGLKLKNYLILVLLIIGTIMTQSCADKKIQDDKISSKETANGFHNAEANNLLGITVYKSPTCECCTHWEDHLKMNGFKVISHKEENMHAIKSKYGVGPKLASCHTAIVDRYVIEGHVPAADIKRLLKERPAIAGLSAPGMPQESPGMQAHDKKPANYAVISFTKSGKTKVYRSY